MNSDHWRVCAGVLGEWSKLLRTQMKQTSWFEVCDCNKWDKRNDTSTQISLSVKSLLDISATFKQKFILLKFDDFFINHNQRKGKREPWWQRQSVKHRNRARTSWPGGWASWGGDYCHHAIIMMVIIIRINGEDHQIMILIMGNLSAKSFCPTLKHREWNSSTAA